MRKELKRLFMGFIYSLMTFSFIMMPIPFSGLAHAQRGIEVDTYTNEDGDTSRKSVYKQGDDLGEAVNDAKAENYGETQEGFAAFIGQATSGMMALSLLNALFFKYKHEDPIESVFYGDDCPKNRAAKITIRVAQLGSLMYLIGDLTANFKFTKVAADAADELQNFNPTEKTDFENMTEEEMAARREADPKAADNAKDEADKQIQAFEKLLDILNGKKDAIETKKKMTTIASLAYGISTGYEIGSLIYCASKCTLNTAMKDAKLSTGLPTLSGTVLSLATAKANAMAAVPEPTGATKAMAIACGKLIAAVTANNSKIGVKVSKDIAKGAAEVTLKLGTSAAGAAEGVSTFGKLGSIISEPVSNDPKVQAAAYLAEFGDVLEKIKKGKKLADTAETAAQTAQAAVEKAANGTIAGLTFACIPEAVVPVEAYLAAYYDYAYTPVTCCGGDGIGTAQIVQYTVDSQSYLAQLKALGGAKSTATMLKSGLRIFGEEAAGKIAERVGTAAGKQALMSAFAGMPGVGQAVTQGAMEEVASATLGALASAARPKGSYPAFGLPKLPMVNFKNDIVLGGILGNYSSIKNPTPDQLEQMKRLREMENNKLFDLDEGSKMFAKSTFEGTLRSLARQSFASREFVSPQEDMKFIVQQEQEIKNIMFFFNQMLDEVPANELAGNGMKKHRYWDMVMNMVSNLVMPKAHAFIGGMSGNMGLSVAGMFLPMLGQMLGLPPEWNSILKVGQKIMMVQAVLGGLMKRWGLVSPLGRSITWGVMTGVLLLVRKWDGDAIDKIKERITVVESERDRYENSVARRTAGPGKSYQGANYKKNNYQANSQNAGGAFIKTCVNATQRGFKPAGSCPGNTTKSTFEIDKSDPITAKVVAPQSPKGLSTLSNLASKTANGSLKESDISGSNLAEIERMDAAIRAHNDKLIEGLDKFNDKIFKGKKNKPASLASTIAKARNAITGSTGPINGSLAAFGNPSSAPSTIANKKDEDSGIVTPGSNKGGSAGGGGAATPSAGGFDLDLLGDDMGGEGMADATGDAAGETAAKAEENLNDFEIKYDDINKKTEVSIFKILSNRYILSYPKVLEEEIMDTGGGDTKAPEESKSLEDQLDQVKQ